jgi:hypothetical protein
MAQSHVHAGAAAAFDRRAQRLFTALDGRDLLINGQSWHLEVYGILEDAGKRWVQLALDGPTHQMLTLALAARSSVEQVVRALSNWLEDPSETQPVGKRLTA